MNSSIWERFTKRARQVFQYAQEEAKTFNHSYIGDEHLLIGLLREEGGVAGRVLREVGLRTERVRTVVERYTGGSVSNQPFNKIDLDPSTKRILQYAVEEAKRMDKHYVSTEHLLLAMVRQESSTANQVLRKFGVTSEQVRRQTRRMIKEDTSSKKSSSESSGSTDRRQRATTRANKGSSSSSKEKSKTPLIDQLATDLTTLAEEGKLDPVIGRKTEIERVIQVLARRRKNNPALIGEPGVGKSAIIEGLAQRVVDGKVPNTLANKRVLQLDVGSLVAGTMYRGQFEERLKRVIEELKASDAILFIDEVHMLVGAGSAGSSVDAANILKPSLARGELQCVGATTLDEYRKHIESDAALERRFQPVRVDEPSPEETVEILKGIKGAYEAHHNLTITDEAIESAVKLSTRYVTERFLPDKAIDLIDESSSRVRLYRGIQSGDMAELQTRLDNLKDQLTDALDEKQHHLADELRETISDIESDLALMKLVNTEGLEVGPDDIADVLAMWTGIPVMQLTEAESQRLLEMESDLQQHIVGQDEAIIAISKAVRRARSGLKNPRRPIGSFIFLGPTGVGKTELTKQLAKFLFGSEDALIQLDMSEFMERHTVSRLIGSPPGYVGYEDAGQLTEAIRRRPYSIIVFDEIEKAHPEVFNILLQIMEEGHLSDSKGSKVDFRNAMIIMTSNVGAATIKRGPSFGFTFSDASTAAGGERKHKDMQKKLMDEMKRSFRPEFINRVDNIVVFRELSEEHILDIVDILLRELNERLEEQELVIEMTEAAKAWLGKTGYNVEFGARPLRRLVQDVVADKLSDELLSGNFTAGDTIIMDVEEDEIVLHRKEVPEPLPA